MALADRAGPFSFSLFKLTAEVREAAFGLFRVVRQVFPLSEIMSIYKKSKCDISISWFNL